MLPASVRRLLPAVATTMVATAASGQAPARHQSPPQYQALARDPQHADTLNTLGYLLAEQGTRLEEAEALVQQALAHDPEAGAYLDSLG
ncbi:MAG: tetratricopeptide repeat protein, partial [Gemmatimonadetes bacterium]|nr:tetratricopeptide repeat protein [Gemmatimonadota bacterium]